MWDAKIPEPKMTISATRPPIASRWRRKRRRAYDHWLRALTSSPASTVASTRPTVPGCSMSLTCATSGFWSWSGVSSVIADPRIEISVEDVRNQVEEDDDRRRDHQV